MSDEATAAPTVQSVVEEFMGDAEKTAADILAIVRERVGDGVKTTVRSVASSLSVLRRKHGVEAVPHRGRNGASAAGYGLKPWLLERMTDGEPRTNVMLAKEATEHFGREVTSKNVASYRATFKREGVENLQPSQAPAAAE